MNTAGRMVVFGTLVAMVIGVGVLFVRNGYRTAGMFESYWSATLKSNAGYYPHVGKDSSESRAEEEPTWSSEGY